MRCSLHAWPGNPRFAHIVATLDEAVAECGLVIATSAGWRHHPQTTGAARDGDGRDRGRVAHQTARSCSVGPSGLTDAEIARCHARQHSSAPDTRIEPGLLLFACMNCVARGWKATIRKHQPSRRAFGRPHVCRVAKCMEAFISFMAKRPYLMHGFDSSSVVRGDTTESIFSWPGGRCSGM